MEEEQCVLEKHQLCRGLRAHSKHTTQYVVRLTAGQDQFQALPLRSVLVTSLELVAISQERPYLQNRIRKGKSQEEGEPKYAKSLLGKDLRSPHCLLVFCCFN